ncbi:mannitol dehydrogenase family protein [Microbacterium sp. A84]|uniref:mannitol dehydrogenase family protein n=1 Tax=Microbacterium sp. A84 TaxID=3450715 RepID=UPI003F41C4DF
MTEGAPRLTPSTLAIAALHHPDFAVPERPAQVGIVHLGLGAFLRSHQAVFTEDAVAATGDRRWGILGVAGRSDTAIRQLAPQGGLFGVLSRSSAGESLRIVGTILDVADPRVEGARVVEAIAAATTHVVTMTITEKGYPRGTTGGLDLSSTAVRADLPAIAAAIDGRREPATSTPLGLLVAGLALRSQIALRNRIALRSGNGQPLTVVCCDNLPENGPLVRRLVIDAVEGAGADAKRAQELHRWIDAQVRFPSTMVDRITPATTDADRLRAADLSGLYDEGLVVAEPYRQWIIEDDFAGPRPRWELAGAILTDDVRPYERIKLRVLNASHTLLALLGSVCGHTTIAEAVCDARLREAALRMLIDDVLPTLDPVPGLDLLEYCHETLGRFANPALNHTTRQVASDTSHKLPIRLLEPAAERLAAGHIPRSIALAVASWIVYIDRHSTGGRLDDPLAPRLTAIAGGRADSAPDAVIEELFALEAVFPPAVRDSPDFRAAVRHALDTVHDLASVRAF